MTIEALSPKAAQLVCELEAAEGILEHERRIFTFGAETGADDRSVALMNIRYDLRQAVLTLRLLTDRLLRVRELDLFLREQHLPNGPLPQRPVLDAIHLVHALGEENEIYIKALYHTLYEVHELLDVGGLKDVVPKSLGDELDRIITYRNKVVVHKKGQRVHLRGARAFHFENLEQTFGHAVFAGEDMARQVGPVWARAKMHVPGACRDEQNAYKRMSILYGSLCALPGALRAEVKSLIEKYGVGSDTPLVIATLLHGLCVALVGDGPLPM